MTQRTDFLTLTTPARLAEGNEAVEQFVAFLKDLIAERRRDAASADVWKQLAPGETTKAVHETARVSAESTVFPRSRARGISRAQPGCPRRSPLL